MLDEIQMTEWLDGLKTRTMKGYTGAVLLIVACA